MSDFKLVLNLPNGNRAWINLAQAVKMERTPDGRFFLYMINGEVFQISGRDASTVENYFEIK